MLLWDARTGRRIGVLHVESLTMSIAFARGGRDGAQPVRRGAARSGFGTPRRAAGCKRC